MLGLSVTELTVSTLRVCVCACVCVHACVHVCVCVCVCASIQNNLHLTSVYDIYALGSAPPCLLEVSPMLPLKQFQCSADCILNMALSRPFKESRRVLPFSVPLSSRPSIV